MASDDTPKRKKASANVRQKRRREIEDLKDRIGFKEQRRVAAENSRDYTKCDHLCEQIKSLRAEVRELEAKYKQLQNNHSHPQRRGNLEVLLHFLGVAQVNHLLHCPRTMSANLYLQSLQ